MDTRQNNNRDDRNENDQDKDLPGYPHYPSEEDIMNPQHGFRKIAADEELANSSRITSRSLDEKKNTDDTIEPLEDDDEIRIVSGTEADVTEDDLVILGDRDADQDLGDDELTRKARVDDLEEEQDLDIPGAQMNDEEALGQDDEKNNYYSLGGDRHENLEEESSENND